MTYLLTYPIGKENKAKEAAWGSLEYRLNRPPSQDAMRDHERPISVIRDYCSTSLDNVAKKLCLCIVRNFGGSFAAPCHQSTRGQEDHLPSVEENLVPSRGDMLQVVSRWRQWHAEWACIATRLVRVSARRSSLHRSPDP
jgi:hypothetical protein